MQLKLANVLLLVTISTLATGCQWSEDRSFDREVLRDEIVGVWVLRAESVRDLGSVGVRLGGDRSSHRIELNSDGGCELRTFLPEHVEIMGAPPAVTSSQCRWRLKGGVPDQELAIELLDHRGKTIHYSFTEVDGELVIWQYIGDPDAWRYLEYSRMQPHPPPSPAAP